MQKTNADMVRPLRRGKIRKTLLEQIEPYLYLLPAMTIFAVFLYYPFINTIRLSTYLTNNLGVAKVFVGFRNYASILSSAEFWNSLRVTALFVLMVSVGGMLMGLVTSLLTHRDFPFVTLPRASYALPLAIASAAASMAFRMILHPTNGLLNLLLGTRISWLNDPQYALLVVAILTIWLSTGINYIFISAGLRNIPDELYESASIDGAGGFKKFLHITLPGLSPTLFFQIIINMINAFQTFSQIRILTQGGPREGTNVIVYAIYKDAFINQRFGQAAARSVILFLIILSITLVQFSLEKRSVNYG